MSNSPEKARFPNLGKLSLAIIEHFVEPIIGKGTIDVIKSPIVAMELQNLLEMSLVKAEQRFIAEYPDKLLCSAILNLSIKDSRLFREAVNAFYYNPNDPQLSRVLHYQLCNGSSALSQENIQKGVSAYLKFLKEALVNANNEFRKKLNSQIAIETQENTERIMNILEVLVEQSKTSQNLKGQILSEDPTIKIVSLANDTPDEVLKQAYFDVCEGEELFEEFCTDVIEIGDCRIAFHLSLMNNFIKRDKVDRIIANLSKIFAPKHLKIIFYNACLIHDEMNISDDVIKTMVTRGLSKKEIIDTVGMPRKASSYLCRLVFLAIYEQGITPLRFETKIFSQPFINYCVNIDFERTLLIIKNWEPMFGRGALISDAVACIIRMIDNAQREFSRNELIRFLKKWYKEDRLNEMLEHSFDPPTDRAMVDTVDPSANRLKQILGIRHIHR